MALATRFSSWLITSVLCVIFSYLGYVAVLKIVFVPPHGAPVDWAGNPSCPQCESGNGWNVNDWRTYRCRNCGHEFRAWKSMSGEIHKESTVSARK